MSDDGRVQRFNVHSAPYEPLPGFGGKQAILYSSLSVGDCCYLRQGMNVTFEMAENFHDVTVLIPDTPIAVDGLEN